MYELTMEQAEAASGGDGVTAGAGAVAGATIGLIGGPADAAVGALLGAVIWEGVSIYEGVG